MLSMKLSNAPIDPHPGRNIPRNRIWIRIKAYGDSILPNALISLSCANFPREQGTRTAKRPVGVMTRPRFAEKKI